MPMPSPLACASGWPSPPLSPLAPGGRGAFCSAPPPFPAPLGLAGLFGPAGFAHWLVPLGLPAFGLPRPRLAPLGLGSHRLPRLGLAGLGFARHRLPGFGLTR